MRTVICGGRDRRVEGWELAALDDLRATLPISVVLSGCYGTTDLMGEAWARDRGVPVEEFPPDWNTHGRAAGPIRNAEMAKNADAVIAFDGGRGTRSMLREAEKRGLRVVRLALGDVLPSPRRGA